MRIISMPAEQDAGAAEVLEHYHPSGSAFDGTVVLLDDIVQILWLANPDRIQMNRPLFRRRAALLHKSGRVEVTFTRDVVA